LLIESKIMCALSNDQLQRHLRTAKKRGFTSCALLLLCLTKNNRKLPKGVLIKTDAMLFLVETPQSSPVIFN